MRVFLDPQQKKFFGLGLRSLSADCRLQNFAQESLTPGFALINHFYEIIIIIQFIPFGSKEISSG